MKRTWEQKGSTPERTDRDCEMLASLLGNLPVSLALRQFHRCKVIQEVTGGFHGTVLDIGCGDAAVWEAMNRTSKVYGIDVDPRAIRRASGRISAIVEDVCAPDLASRLDAEWGVNRFALITAISSFEHIPDVMSALCNARELLTEDGKLILIVPSPAWTRGAPGSWWRRCCPRLTMALAGAADGLFQHWTLLDQHGWEALALACGLRVMEIRYLYDPFIERAFWGLLPLAALSQVARTFLGRYPTSFIRRSLHTRLAECLSNAITGSTACSSRETTYCYDHAILLGH